MTAEISIAGRFLVLIPFADKVSVSQKIKTEEERQRLKQLIQSIKPKGFGVIVRTVAEEKKVAELDNELKILVKNAGKKLSPNFTSRGSFTFLENSRTVGIIRDLFSPSFKILIPDPAGVYRST